MKSLYPIHLFLHYIKHISSPSIIGFSRSLLAMAMLLTLSFNNIDSLISRHYLLTLHTNLISYRCNFFLIFHSSTLFFPWLLAIFVLLLTISGYFMQLSCLLHCWVTASFTLLRPVYAGGDNVQMLLTMLLVPICLFDKRKNHWDNHSYNDDLPFFIQNLFLFIIKLQVAYIYFDSVFGKLRVKEWRNGTVLYYWFNHNFFGLSSPISTELLPLLQWFPLISALAWGTLIFEAALSAAFLYSDRIKLILLKCGIIFHFSILLIHGYASFFMAMSAALFLYLYPAKKRFTLQIFQ